MTGCSPPWLDTDHQQKRYRRVVRGLKGFAFGLLIGLFFGPVVGLVVGLASVLVLGLARESARRVSPDQGTWDFPDNRLVFWLVVGLVSGLVVGLLHGLTYGLVAYWYVPAILFGMLYGLAFGLLFGLFHGAVFGLDAGSGRIHVMGRLAWSGIQSRPVVELAYWPGLTLTGGLLFGLAFGLADGPIPGLVLGLLLGLGYGLYSESIAIHVAPNQGMRDSMHNGLAGGLVFGLLGGVLGGLSSGLTFGLSFGLAFGLIFGLRAVIQHILLRYFLWRAGVAPLDYADFLCYTSARQLTRQVGGGFIFRHRLLMAYFAGEDPLTRTSWGEGNQAAADAEAGLLEQGDDEQLSHTGYH